MHIKTWVVLATHVLLFVALMVWLLLLPELVLKRGKLQMLNVLLSTLFSASSPSITRLWMSGRKWSFLFSFLPVNLFLHSNSLMFDFSAMSLLMPNLYRQFLQFIRLKLCPFLMSSFGIYSFKTTQDLGREPISANNKISCRLACGLSIYLRTISLTPIEILLLFSLLGFLELIPSKSPRT